MARWRSSFRTLGARKPRGQAPRGERWGEEDLIEALRDGANVPFQRVEALSQQLRDCSERPSRGRGIDRA
jgi:hypothetical protein